MSSLRGRSVEWVFFSKYPQRQTAVNLEASDPLSNEGSRSEFHEDSRTPQHPRRVDLANQTRRSHAALEEAAAKRSWGLHATSLEAADPLLKEFLLLANSHAEESPPGSLPRQLAVEEEEIDFSLQRGQWSRTQTTQQLEEEDAAFSAVENNVQLAHIHASNLHARQEGEEEGIEEERKGEEAEAEEEKEEEEEEGLCFRAPSQPAASAASRTCLLPTSPAGEGEEEGGRKDTISTLPSLLSLPLPAQNVPAAAAGAAAAAAVNRRMQQLDPAAFGPAGQYANYLSSFLPPPEQQQQLQLLQQAVAAGLGGSPTALKRLQRRAQAAAYANAVSAHPLVQGVVRSALTAAADILGNISVADIVQGALASSLRPPLAPLI
ncbi:hypothetical protein Efla_000787 [Eimeria flavescens]